MPAPLVSLHSSSPLVTRRHALRWLAAGALGAAALPAQAAWELVRVGGNDYVTAPGIKAFYKFGALERSGNVVAFKSPRLVMRLRTGSQEMYINSVKFMLSLPVLAHDGKVLISRVDLSKLIDPVLRPSHIASAPFTTVVIDPGHGGHDSGAKGVYNNEKTYTLDVGLRAGRLLQQRGLRVIMTRTTDTYPSLPARVALANATPNCVFVSVHFNHGGSSAQGIETYALAPQGTTRSRKEESTNDDARFQGNSRDSENIALATAIHASLLQQTGAPDRGIMRDRWFVLKGIERPGVLLECGFVSNPTECGRINQVAYRDKLAMGICSGIMNYRKALSR